MKANELRIGNLVIYDDEVVEIGEITHQGAYKILGGCERVTSKMWMPYKIIKPIPLTEEWLIKFGFEKGGNWFDEGGMIELKEKEDAYVMLEDSYYHCSQDLFYVHQLQNLYFALTGEELTHKEDEEKD